LAWERLSYHVRQAFVEIYAFAIFLESLTNSFYILLRASDFP